MRLLVYTTTIVLLLLAGCASGPSPFTVNYTGSASGNFSGRIASFNCSGSANERPVLTLRESNSLTSDLVIFAMSVDLTTGTYQITSINYNDGSVFSVQPRFAEDMGLNSEDISRGTITLTSVPTNTDRNISGSFRFSATSSSGNRYDASGTFDFAVGADSDLSCLN